jgi:hypothetical protein
MGSRDTAEKTGRAGETATTRGGRGNMANGERGARRALMAGLDQMEVCFYLFIMNLLFI